MASTAQEKPIRYVHTVCLIKGCTGATLDVHTWGGRLLVKTHHHDLPSSSQAPPRG